MSYDDYLMETELRDEEYIAFCKHNYNIVYDDYVYCNKCGKMITYEEYKEFEYLNYVDLM